MKKIFLILLGIVFIIGGIWVAILISKPNESEIPQRVTEEAVYSNQTNTKNENTSPNLVENETMQTDAKEERISPNAFITYKRTYKECGHTTSEYKEIPKELVNLTKEELQEKYSDWSIDKFTDTDIVLDKEEEGSCDEHFVVRDVDGMVTVFKKQDDGTETKYQETDIATEYLTDTDKMNMEKGIEVNGKQNLNQLIEDYE